MFKPTKITFNLKAPPFSVNAMYYKKTFNRTREAREWATIVFGELEKPHAQQQMELFRKAFDDKTEGVRLILTFYYPRDIILTKAGYVSSRSMDLTNVEKPLQDLIFDKKYNARKYPEGCKNLNLNVGFSHPVAYAPPEDVKLAVEKNNITVSGANKASVGETAAQIRKIWPPEPYQDKGIRYKGEVVRRKAGKKVAGTGTSS